MTTAGALTQYQPLPPENNTQIVTGPDGNLWATNGLALHLTAVTTAGAEVARYNTTAGGFPAGITKGPDGAVWYADYAADQIGRMSTTGVLTTFAAPGGSNPTGIVTGPDGNIWYTEYTGTKIGRLIF
jgi:virginiamycin B lyase